MENRDWGQCSGRNRIYPFEITDTCRWPSFAGSSCRNLSRGTTTSHRPLRGNIARESGEGKKSVVHERKD